MRLIRSFSGLRFRSPSSQRPAALGLGVFAVATGIAACSDSSPTSTTTKQLSTADAAYIDSALAFEDTVFYYHSKVNFAAQKTAVRDSGSRSGAQHFDSVLYDVIDYSINPFLRNAGDQHSDFFRPDEAPGAVNTPASDPRFHVSGLMLPAAAGVRTANPVAYLWFPTYDGTNDRGRADSTQTVIRALDQNNPCGWVLDLRFNPGGQPTAMMSALNPLIGDTPVSRTQRGFGGWVDYDNVTVYLYTQGGVAGVYDPASGQSYPEVQATSEYTLKRPNSPVAILTGPLTASAGELLTLGFRSGTVVPSRTFGEATYGVTTVPYNRTLSDGGFLNITAALMMDRNGQLYGGKLTPDQAVANAPAYNTLLPTQAGTNPDVVVRAAATWLQGLTACGGTTAALAPPAYSRDISAAAPPALKSGFDVRRVSRHWSTRLMRALAPGAYTRRAIAQEAVARQR